MKGDTSFKPYELEIFPLCVEHSPLIFPSFTVSGLLILFCLLKCLLEQEMEIYTWIEVDNTSANDFSIRGVPVLQYDLLIQRPSLFVLCFNLRLAVVHWGFRLKEGGWKWMNGRSRIWCHLAARSGNWKRRYRSSLQRIFLLSSPVYRNVSVHPFTYRHET